jgi:fatty-acyl-CoA synthase
VLPRHLHDVDDARMPVGSCGHARTGMQISVRSQQGLALEPLQTGEVWVRGGAVFAGYLANDTANAAAFEQGWFRTGDVGHLDDNGFLYLTGRLSDMFISGGSNIYPREIEEAILAYPGIREVCVVGLPDDKWGEVGVAVVACDGSPPHLDQLVAFLEPRLARYKLPRRLIIWDELPKSAYGKITKSAVKASLLAGRTPPC